MFEVGLAEDVEDAEIRHAADLSISSRPARRAPRGCSRFGPTILTEFAPLTPEMRLLDVVLDVLREIEDDPRRSSPRTPPAALVSLSLVSPAAIRRRASAARRVRRWRRRGVAAVVRPAVLRDHGDDLGMAQQDLAHLARRLGSPASSDIVGGMEARIQRLPSSSAGRNSLPRREQQARSATRKPTPTATMSPAMRERQIEHRRVDATQRPHHDASRPPAPASGSSSDASTGVTVKVAISAPASA